MQKLFNYKILRLIPIVFLIVIAIRITIDYNDTVNREYDFAKKEAQVLNTYAIAHRDYYRHLFVNKTLPINKNTIKALPAYSSLPISKVFVDKNELEISLQTVSDNARNQNNKADQEETQAISFFKKNKDYTNYFKKYDDFYQYASVLRIEKKCLTCHGDKKNAPKFIRDNYSSAYNYKLGEVRGIMSIKIPIEKLHNYFFQSFIESVIFDITLLLLLFLGISYITRRSKLINILLEEEVNIKTKELSHIFNTDKLTNLPNRNKLIEDINLSNNKESKHLAFINIDNFKDINDFYGYEFGDQILKEIGILLKLKCKCDKGTVYKLPSDEFGLFSSSTMSRNEFVEAVSEIMGTMNSMCFIVNENKVYLTFSCGISSNEKKLMRRADIALRVAKNENKHFVVFEKNLDLSTKIQENSKKVLLLREAIKFDQITPYFQPIYNVKTNKIEKYECLVRIIQSDGKVVLPYEFLDVAIKSKQYSHITENMINKSFEFFKDKDFEFSINLSIYDILNDNTVNFIMKKLETYKNSKKVVFEILENDKIENYEKMKKFIFEMKKFGCQFAVDDFGSGYSNFAHIYELNFNYIKIDSSLVKNIIKDEKSRIITKAIIDFSASLNIKTIAEFVEDKESLELLGELGVDFIQGYYIGKPSSKLCI